MSRRRTSLQIVLPCNIPFHGRIEELRHNRGRPIGGCLSAGLVEFAVMYMESVKMRPARLQGTPSARYRENLLYAFPTPLPEAEPRSFADGPSALYDTPRKSSQRPETHHTRLLTPTSSSTNTTTRLYRVLHVIHPHSEGRTDAQRPSSIITSYSMPRDINPSAPNPCPAPSRTSKLVFFPPMAVTYLTRLVLSRGRPTPDNTPMARRNRMACLTPVHTIQQEGQRGRHTRGRDYTDRASRIHEEYTPKDERGMPRDGSSEMTREAEAN